MTANDPAASPKTLFHKVGQNLYRLESSSGYYGLFKRGGKQIRRSLKTTDAALARRRLAAVREKVARLNQTKASSRITFAELADRWLTNARVSLKESSASRLAVCLKGLKPYFCGMTVRNVTHRQCEAWANKRGKSISPSAPSVVGILGFGADSPSFACFARSHFDSRLRTPPASLIPRCASRPPSAVALLRRTGNPHLVGPGAEFCPGQWSNQGRGWRADKIPLTRPSAKPILLASNEKEAGAAEEQLAEG